jgi:hypothetical protein
LFIVPELELVVVVIAVRLATLPDGDRTTGAFLGDDGPVPW